MVPGPHVLTSCDVYILPLANHRHHAYVEMHMHLISSFHADISGWRIVRWIESWFRQEGIHFDIISDVLK